MNHVNSRVASWLVASILALGASGARAQGIVAQTVSDGAVGALYGRDAARAVFAYVSQLRSPATGQAETFLFFEIDESCSGCAGGLTNVLFGSGKIPSADLASDGLGRLVLDTDTSGNAAFTTYACPNPPAATPPFCALAQNRGRVRMTLAHASDAPVWQQSGSWTAQYGNVLVTQSGTQVSGAATGEGNVAGFAFPAGSAGTIGAARQVAVTIQQGR